MKYKINKVLVILLIKICLIYKKIKLILKLIVSMSNRIIKSNKIYRNTKKYILLKMMKKINYNKKQKIHYK
jgi:hypothetical protein